MARKKVLVAGASGVVGFAAAKHFSHKPDWDVVGVSRRPPRRLVDVELLSVDLTDRDASAAAFSKLTDVTHVVYAALYEKPGLIPGWYERDQMETNLTMLRNLLEPLQQSAPLEHFSLLQGTKAYGAHVGPMKVPGREREPRHQHENFYWLQEDYLSEQQQRGGGWHWTILRPQIIFGEALGSNMNAIPALGVYAALQRQDGLPLDYPGGAPFLSEAVDADLLASALYWAATSPQCRGEIFNVTNGDVFSMRNVWPVIADAFGMEAGDDKPMSLAQELPGREAEWEKIVERFALAAPTSLAEFVGQSFIYADVLLGYGLTEPPRPTLVSTIKARQAGFAECIDTEDMFRKWIRLFQDERLFPPARW